MQRKSRSRFLTITKPYRDQFKRSPLWVKVVAVMCMSYIAIPIDLFDILFPWMAYSEDLFLAGILLKLLHKYGGLPDEDRITPVELIRQIFGKDKH